MKILGLKNLAEKAIKLDPRITVQLSPKTILSLISRNEKLTDALLDARLYVPKYTLKYRHIEETLENYGSYVDLED